MKYRIKVLKPIVAEETELGVGAMVFLRCASKPMIKLLRERYQDDQTCLIGDIKYLFSFDGIGISTNQAHLK